MDGPGGRRQPERTCVVCRARQGKRGLVRVARLAEGGVVIDPTGKGPGRGAYVCPSLACWQDPALARRLGHALKTNLTEADRARLTAFAAGLAEQSDHG